MATFGTTVTLRRRHCRLVEITPICQRQRTDMGQIDPTDGAAVIHGNGRDDVRVRAAHRVNGFGYNGDRRGKFGICSGHSHWSVFEIKQRRSLDHRAGQHDMRYGSGHNVVLEKRGLEMVDGGQVQLLLEPRSNGGFVLTIDGVDIRPTGMGSQSFALATGDRIDRASSSRSYLGRGTGSRFRTTIDRAGLVLFDGTSITEIHEGDIKGKRVGLLKIPDLQAALRAFPLCRLTPGRKLQQQTPSSDIVARGGIDGKAIGRVTVAVEVGADGRVANCLVTPAGRDAALDAAICREVRTNTRFIPATDTQGIPPLHERPSLLDRPRLSLRVSEHLC